MEGKVKGPHPGGIDEAWEDCGFTPNKGSEGKS